MSQYMCTIVEKIFFPEPRAALATVPLGAATDATRSTAKRTV